MLRCCLLRPPSARDKSARASLVPDVDPNPFSGMSWVGISPCDATPRFRE